MRDRGDSAAARTVAQAVVWLCLAITTAPRPTVAQVPEFEHDVAPILEAHCLRCHNQADAKGDLVLETSTSALSYEGLIALGDPDASRLVEVVSGPEPEMPADGKPLSAAEIDTLRRWIAGGAPWPAERLLLDKPQRDLSWWSLQPLRPITPPALGIGDRNPIDAFIRLKLSEHGLSRSAEADRRTLIRRVTFDLTGLPPAPEEVAAFLADAGPAAHERLVDDLLASPHHGERWARHWLDVARYSESQGFERDKMRPHAWRYRDYVIAAFNEDKPYDQFVREQLCGDVLEPPTREKIIATGFLVAGPWDEVGTLQQSAVMKSRVREEELEEIISAVGQTFLGLTINCARCHAHKFDPISHEDYYAFKAVFEGVRHGDRTLLSPTEQREWEQYYPPPVDKKAAEKAAKDATVPQQPMTYAACPADPPPTYVLARGDVANKITQVTAHGLSAVTRPSADLKLSPDSAEAERRRRFAGWLTDRDNPLFARVMVNRVWHYHFGRGLVATPNDLGINGGQPSHPQLLDWLAGEFIRGGWSLKQLHRLIMTSATYRQSSLNSPTAAAVDFDNRWLWRFSPRRLEAEEVRDAMLAASGQINWQMGGPGFQPFDLTINNSHFYAFRDKLGPEFNRRTIYRTGIQSLRDPVQDSLDCPDRATKTPVRSQTITPIQALALMNDSFILRQSDALAGRACREAGSAVPAQLYRAYQLTLSRDPTAEELQRAAALVAEHGLEQVCWVLFNSSEFIHVQ